MSAAVDQLTSTNRPAGNTNNHQAPDNNPPLASSSNRPSDADSGGSPTPRNESELSCQMAWGICSTRAIAACGATAGIRCVNHTARVPAPEARASTT